MHLLSQGEGQGHGILYQSVYDATRELQEVDPILQNGVFYTYPYYNAKGHPFLDRKDFTKGDLIFRDKRYEGVTLNYDVFNQQVILSRQAGKVQFMYLLSSEFVSEFLVNDKRFRFGSLGGQPARFYQVVAETGTVSCYYIWYKNRLESREGGGLAIYSFSEAKHRRYLSVDGDLYRLQNNRSLVKVLPAVAGDMVKDFLKENRIRVSEANDTIMNRVIRFCDTILETENQKQIAGEQD
jgi:hypothetical protein